jgi:beta-glucosidase
LKDNRFIQYALKSVKRNKVIITEMNLKTATMYKRKIISGLICVFLTVNLFAQTNNVAVYKDLSKDFEIRTADLVKQMTLEEKISQLGNDAPAIPRLGIQKYDWWNEGLHGVARAGKATVFPQAIGMAASFDTDLMYKVADVISTEGRAKHHDALRNNNFDRYYGLTYWSPNINIFRDPRWGRGHETYGEDPFLTGQMGIQFVKGLQGNDPKYFKLVATAKHFAVHSGPESERHTFNAVTNSRDLWETYLPAFEDLIVKGKAYSIMGAYNRVDGESASASWMLLQDILRNQWGFEGFVVSDCGAINDIYSQHKIVNSAEEASAIGVRRGCDLDRGTEYQKALSNAVKLGYIDEKEIDLAVYRLMLGRMKLGMFDPPTIVPYAQIPINVNESEAHDKVAMQMAHKSMTLLKNNGILPLNPSKIKKIAVVGPNAASINALYGNYNGEASHPVTVIEGIRKAVGKNIDVQYFEGCPLVVNLEDINYKAIEDKYLFSVSDNGDIERGLKGEYYVGKNLEGKPSYIRQDANINFNWEDQSPLKTELAQGIIRTEQAIEADNFSIRWTGKIKAPVTGKYTLGVMSDDGCKLWINGNLIADGWSNHAMEAFVTEVEGVKDEVYDVKIEYYESTGSAGVRLVWQIPGAIKEKTEKKDNLSAAELKIVKDADVAIFVGGLDANWEGEEMSGRKNIAGFDRGDRTKIELPEAQLKAIKAMQETGTPVVLVLMAGSSISFNGLDENLPAILMGWYPGQRGGDAVADVLFGKYNPAGRLPVTFYKSTDELGDFNDYSMRAGKGRTYRYYQGKALYPFGHGLSYTNFTYSDIKIDKTKAKANEEIKVTIKVKNTGNYDGDEVVQLYTSDAKSDTWMPIKQLRKFQRIALKKGEEKTVEFTIKPSEDMHYYDALKGSYTVEPGDFEIQVGASSCDIRLKQLINIE